MFSRITERNSFRDKLSTLIPNRAAEALGSSYCCSPASGRPIGCRFAKDMEDASGSSSSPAVLRNKYWVLRHGRSVPNERGLIVSSLVRTSPSQQRSFFLRLRAPSIAYPNLILSNRCHPGLLTAGERHEAGVRAGPAGSRAGARGRRKVPEGTGSVPHCCGFYVR